MDFDEQKWERIRDVLIAEGSGKAPRIASTRTLFGIPSSVDQAIEAIVAEDEATADFCRAVRGKIVADDYYVSPCDRGGEIDFATAKAVLAQLDGWSLSVQLHKLLGFR